MAPRLLFWPSRPPRADVGLGRGPLLLGRAPVNAPNTSSTRPRAPMAFLRLFVSGVMPEATSSWETFNFA